MDFGIAALAAMGASIFSNPFDVVKTRMQLQGELKARGKHVIHYKNTIHAAYTLAKHEGINALQKGLAAALTTQGVRNGVRLGLYQWFHANGFICDSSGATIFYKSFLASCTSGALGAFISNPFALIKTHLQAQAAKNIAVGYQHGHIGLVQAFKSIYNEHGISGLWRGTFATVLRSVVGSSAQLTSFAKTKDALKKHETFQRSTVLTAGAASIVGGAVPIVFMTPFDLVSTRLYNQKTDSQGKGLLYNGIIDCFYKIWKVEGFFGLYKGLGANYMRQAPHSAFTLIFWDVLKDFRQNYRAKK